MLTEAGELMEKLIAEMSTPARDLRRAPAVIRRAHLSGAAPRPRSKRRSTFPGTTAPSARSGLRRELLRLMLWLPPRHGKTHAAGVVGRDPNSECLRH